jgi:hypothetical protein
VPSALQVREGARIYGGAAYTTCCARASPAAVRVLFGQHAQPDTHARTHMPTPTRMQARRAWARRNARVRDAPTSTLHEQASAIMRAHTLALWRASARRAGDVGEIGSGWTITAADPPLGSTVARVFLVNGFSLQACLRACQNPLIAPYYVLPSPAPAHAMALWRRRFATFHHES